MTEMSYTHIRDFHSLGHVNLSIHHWYIVCHSTLSLSCPYFDFVTTAIGSCSSNVRQCSYTLLEALKSVLRHICSSGKRLQLDFHFCQAESNLSYWRGLLGDAHFRVEHIAVLLEMVYFMWFEMGQLQRGICMLTKVIV